MNWLDELIDAVTKADEEWSPCGIFGENRRREIERQLGWPLPAQVAEFADRYGNAGFAGLMIVVNGGDDWGTAIEETKRLLAGTELNDGQSLVICPFQECYIIHNDTAGIFEYIGADGGFRRSSHWRVFPDLAALMSHQLKICTGN